MTTKKTVGKVHFAKIGTTSFHTNTMSLTIRIDINQANEMAGNLERALNRHRMRILEDKDNWLTESEQRAFAENTMYKINRVKTVRRTLTAYTKMEKNFWTTKKKRAIGAIIAGVVLLVAATTGGLYVYSEIQDAKEQSFTNRHAIQNVFDVQDRGATAVMSLQSLLERTVNQLDGTDHEVEYAMNSARADAAVLQLEKVTTDFGQVIKGAMSQTLAPETIQALPEGEVQRMIKNEAMDTGTVSMVQNMGDLLQCQTSFTMAKGTLDVLIHIPLAPADSFLSIYRYQPLPVPVSEHYHATLDMDLSLLAVSNDDSVFTAMTDGQLDDCRRIGKHYACDNLNAIRRTTTPPQPGPDVEMCLFSLFKQRYETVQKTCRVLIRDSPETAVQTGKNEFAVFAKAEYQVPVKCIGDSHVDRRMFTVGKGTTTVTLEPNCRAMTRTHVLTAVADSHSQLWEYDFENPTLVSNLTDGLDFTAFHKARLAGETGLKNHTYFTLDEVSQQLRIQDNGYNQNGWTLRNPIKWPSWLPHLKYGFITTSITFIIAIGAILAIIGAVVRKQNRLNNHPGRRGAQNIIINQRNSRNTGSLPPPPYQLPDTPLGPRKGPKQRYLYPENAPPENPNYNNVNAPN